MFESRYLQCNPFYYNKERGRFPQQAQRDDVAKEYGMSEGPLRVTPGRTIRNRFVLKTFTLLPN